VPRDDGWSVGAVRERCQNLKASLQSRASVSAVELAQYWPGGAENPEKRGRGAWIFCYASYARFMGRAEAGKASGQSQDALLAALAADPVPVTLTDGTTYQCHPKSYLALRWMAHADALLGAMLHSMAKIDYFASDEQESLREEAMLGTTEIQLALGWAAVHPGVGLPFDERTRLPAMPAHIASLTPLDLYRIVQAYRAANLQGLSALPALTDGAPEGNRPTFAMFFANIAAENGVSPDALMRERPLVQLLAQARLSALSREPAKAGS
jgi:hypothetical protein